MKITYKKSGVDYDLLDPVKKLAQKMGAETKNNLNKSGFYEISRSRGESAYVLESKDCYYALVTEGLGTKNLIADRIRNTTGKTYYEVIAHDTVAMIVNDLITVGAKPLTVNAYWAVGDAKWFKDEKRNYDLVTGWKKACDQAGASWGGGETPVLIDILNPDTIDLAGSAFGIIKPKKRLILGDKITAGDDIIFFQSSGIHANGITLARKIIDNIKSGYQQKLGKGKTIGELLLFPTRIYAKVIEEAFDKNADIHYMINITGHGWRKLMRYPKNFSYMINKIPPVPEVLGYLVNSSNLSMKEAYSTFNMGAGFAVICHPGSSKKIISAAIKNNVKANISGKVQNGIKQVKILPLGISFHSSDLKIR